MLVLFTDFGLEGPYIGQVQAVLHQQAPGIPVINLFSDLEPFAIQGAAYLLPAYAASFPPDTVFLCVVDPGVGGDRPGVVVRTDRHWFVGPDEGLFTLVARRSQMFRCWQLPRATGISSTFHGRDVFAPVAAGLARDGRMEGEPLDSGLHAHSFWPDDLYQVVYIDGFGNAITGVRSVGLSESAQVSVNGHLLQRARTFSSVADGVAFWYENANGLLEIAVNRGSAMEQLKLDVGTPFDLLSV